MWEERSFLVDIIKFKIYVVVCGTHRHHPQYIAVCKAFSTKSILILISGNHMLYEWIKPARYSVNWTRHTNEHHVDGCWMEWIFRIRCLSVVVYLLLMNKKLQESPLYQHPALDWLLSVICFFHKESSFYYFSSQWEMSSFRFHQNFSCTLLKRKILLLHILRCN